MTDRTRLCSDFCHPEEPCWLTSDGACMIDPGEWRLERVAIILESEPQTPVAVAQARAQAMWEAWCRTYKEQSQNVGRSSPRTELATR